MNKLLVLVLVTFVLSACAANPDRYADTPESVGNAYITAVEEALPRVADSTERRQLIQFAHDTCNYLDDGHSTDELVDTLVAETQRQDYPGALLDDMASLAGIAVGQYCPEHL